jgi:hypothetical protein
MKDNKKAFSNDALTSPQGTDRRADFNEKKDALKKRRDEVLADIEKNTRLRNYVGSQKKEEFELKGQDRAATLADYDSRIRDQNRQLQRVKSEIDNLHLERKNEVEADKVKIASHYYKQIREPRERHVENIQAQLSSMFSELAGVIIGTQGDNFQAADVRENDADVDDLNKSGTEFGVPSNFFRIPEAEKLSKVRAALAEDDVRKLVNKVKKLTEEFHRKVDADWRKKNPEQAKLLAER